MDPKQVAKMLTAALALPEPHRQYVAKLSAEEQTVFLGLDAATRDAEVQKAIAADPEVYKTAAGQSIRRSAGALAAEIAKRADDRDAEFAKRFDEQAVEIAKQAEVIKAEQAARAQVVLEKRAAELIPLIGDSLPVRVELLKMADAVTDEALRGKVHLALKGANAAFAMLGKNIGTNDGGDGSAIKTPLQAWSDGLTAYAKTQNIANPLDATIPFLKTADGKALKQGLDALRPSAQPS